MADKLTFSLVSPERELFSGDVDQVNLPGSEGDLGILPNHSPLMAAIRTGAITVIADGKETQFFVQGGFADVTPEGLTVLAERAAPLSDVTAESLSADIEAAKASLSTLQGDAALAAQQNLDGLNALVGTL
ncbi:ATP synthase F1 subcomplex epsilon subunit [Litorimonas taeanensis]|uniref:ATP synthase epsilon chain n=1 Tax=Litorimonas taeanensis TaxID=568099 RepID=A0A420WJ29_9PROT|nr:ATP synthase F1 subunit epsilon [Litorimonas taeanensis]RKQ71013.1 ATP synthase F1 subcomplex epsilon subunit [Litorimonas taeanensis]